MDEYDIEPFMPGISPVGKATPAMKEFSVVRPYIPYGTGYNAFRLRPGYSKVKEQISGVGRTEYTPQTFNGKPMRSAYNVVRLPQDYLDLNKNSSPFGKEYVAEVLARDFDKNLNKNFDLNHKNKIGVKQYVPAGKTWGMMQGLYSADTHSVIYPKDDPEAVKRHELQHAIQQRRMNGKKAQTFKGPTRDVFHDRRFVQGKTMSANVQEVEANIVQNKSIRKGYEKFSGNQSTYDTSEKQKKGNLIKSKILNKIPGKPGNFTGRVPTFRAVGGNLIDMFMMSPDYQRAKEDPTFGRGEEERARLQSAYEYGL